MPHAGYGLYTNWLSCFLMEEQRMGCTRERLTALLEAAAIAAHVRERLLGDTPAATMRENFRFQLGMVERAADRLRFWWSHVEPTAADGASLALPGALFPLYYGYRPLRLLAKYGSQAMRKAG